MRNSSKASLIKTLQTIALGALVLLAVLTLSVNFFLLRARSRFSGSLGPELPQRFSMAGVFYLPPHFLIIRNASLFDSPAGGSVLLRSPWAAAQIDLGASFRAKKPVLANIFCWGLEMEERALMPFLRDNLSALTAYFRSFPLTDLRVSVQKARFDTSTSTGTHQRFLANLELMVRGESMRMTGEADILLKTQEGRHFVLQSPVSWDMRLVPVAEGLVFESIEIFRENLYLKGWGKNEGDELLLNGFIFLNTSFHEDDSSSRQENAASKFLRMLIRRKQTIARLELSDADLFVLDLDGRMRIATGGLFFDRLSFSVNNVPVVVSGSLKGENPSLIDARIAVDFSKGPVQKSTENLKKIICTWKGGILPSSLQGDAVVLVHFAQPNKQGALETIEIKLQKALVRFDTVRRLPLFSCASADIRCVSGTDSYVARLDSPAVAVKAIGNTRYILGCSSHLAQGTIDARALIDLRTFPWRLESILRLRGAQAYVLKDLLVHFSKVHGRLFSQMKFQTHPAFGLKGSMCIRGGYLEHFEFFKWLADQFHISSLRRIDFKKVSTDFAVTKRAARMYHIRLDSPDVLLNGYFNLAGLNMVTSKVSLSLSNPILNESPRFQKLVRVMRDAKVDYLRFDFQLSGLLHAMNFKWLESDFKRELQRRIPNFIERRIEQGVEGLLSSP